MKNDQIKKINIVVPAGYRIDESVSTPARIVLTPIVNTIEDIKEISGVDICEAGCRNKFIDHATADQAIAIAKISQLMPYYGGEITRDEWNDKSITKYVIVCRGSVIQIETYTELYSYIAFHSQKDASRFYENNYQLLVDYYKLSK